MRKNSALSFAQFSITVVAAFAIFSVSPAQAQHTSGAAGRFAGGNLFSVPAPRAQNNAYLGRTGQNLQICGDVKERLGRLFKEAGTDAQKLAEATAQYIADIIPGGPPAKSVPVAYYDQRAPATLDIIPGGPPAIYLVSEKTLNTSAGQLVVYEYVSAKGEKIKIERMGHQTKINLSGTQIILKGKRNQIVECS